MKVVFFGTSEFAVPILRAIAEQVSLVVTQPDRPSGRGMRLKRSPVGELASTLGIPIETPVRARHPEFVDRIKAENADLSIVAAYGQILPQEILDATARGAFNLHGSILPAYRGAAPIQRSIEFGERETGVTLIQMDAGMDTGDIVDIRRTTIGDEETAGELQVRLAGIASEMTSDWLQRLASGDYPRTPQDNVQATHAKKIERAETEIKLTGDAAEQHRKARAFTPSPGAFLQTRVGRIRLSAIRFDPRTAAPGTLIEPDVVACVGGALRLVEIQPEGKTRMSGRDFANGFRLRAGDTLI